MVAAQRQHGRHHPECGRDQDRPPLQRQRQQQHGGRKHGVGQDDAGVLQAPRSRSAQHEDCRRQHRGRQRPARAPAHGTDGEAADEQVGVDDQVEGAHRRRGVEPRPGDKGGCEDQRLRIGDARMPAVVIGIPERRVAGVEGRGQKAEEGIELVLGVPRHDRAARDPAACGNRPNDGDHQRHKSQPRQRRWPEPTCSAFGLINRSSIAHARSSQTAKDWRRVNPFGVSFHFPSDDASLSPSPAQSPRRASASIFQTLLAATLKPRLFTSQVQNGSAGRRLLVTGTSHVDFRPSHCLLSFGRSGSRSTSWQRAFTRSSRSSAPAQRPGRRPRPRRSQRAASTLRDLRVAEVVEQDLAITDGKVEAYRVRLKVSFKYED